MEKCAYCGKKVVEEKSLKLMVGSEIHYFDNRGHLDKFLHIESRSQTLSSVILSKTSAELVAIGTGLGGIFYTILGLTERALIMDLFSALAAIVALVIGIEHLRYLKKHNLMKSDIVVRNRNSNNPSNFSLELQIPCEPTLKKKKILGLRIKTIPNAQVPICNEVI